jgi:hypothetical protein
MANVDHAAQKLTLSVRLSRKTLFKSHSEPRLPHFDSSSCRCCSASATVAGDTDGDVHPGPLSRGTPNFRGISQTWNDKLRSIGTATADRDAFVQFCELAIVDIPRVWQCATDDQRRRVRQILFSEGILVDGERKLSNLQKGSLFNVLQRKYDGTKAGEIEGWLPPRDSNPDSLLQRQVS